MPHHMLEHTNSFAVMNESVTEPVFGCFLKIVNIYNSTFNFNKNTSQGAVIGGGGLSMCSPVCNQSQCNQ